jgi:transcriptional regulator with XRE-family HTH domain
MGELARAMDVAVPYLSKVERGESPPLTDARITQAADLMGLGRSRDDLRKAAALARVKLTLSPPPTNAHAEFFAKLVERWEELDADALHSMIEIMRGQERAQRSEERWRHPGDDECDG